MAVSDDIDIVKMTEAADEITGTFFVNFLYWVSKTAVAGDDLLVYDSDDNTLWEAVADGANFSRIYPVKTYVNGVKLQTKDSGTLYVVKQAYVAGHPV
jgi:hypothetical protein